MREAENGTPGLALFDFDGTITRCDSFQLFLQRYVPWPRLAVGVAWLLPVLLRLGLGLIDNGPAKERFLTHFFRGTPEQTFTAMGERFAASMPARMFRPQALARLDRHMTQGDRVIIVTASPETWMRPWAEARGYECLGTRLEYRDGLLTGRIDGLNCRGEEKVRRIREHIRDIKRYTVYAYGDTKGDLPMLGLADQAFFKPFRG